MRILTRLVVAAAVLAVGLGAAACGGRGEATVREYKRVIRTYPFSDPDPIPSPGRIYPYFRFDGYTERPVDKEWTVVELENPFLKITVLPEIGGKIWSAVEKTTGRSFIYDNHVVKFRDIAMRGPWTSGGIEPNYGIIGHTPNCATPVDYLVRRQPDGGASVVVGVLDLLTRTTWRLEISLPADVAYFTTRSYWHNATPIEQPYYTWMNAGIKAAGNLQLVYPGNRYLGHDGMPAPWPIHPENGKDLSFYEQNDFGSYKSYHVVGRHSDFFGAYWHADDFGMARYSRRDDKLGKKAWIWGLSRQGMIWEKLLTDDDGQYVEVQSGRLFNQAAEASSRTPFKQRAFAPYSSDVWTEYWFPVKQTRGFVKANDLGALNIERGAGRLTLRFSPLKRGSRLFEVLDGARVVVSEAVAFEPMRPFVRVVDRDIPDTQLLVRIGGSEFEYAPASADELSRPVASPEGFDWESVFGLYLNGRELVRQREYARARTALETCLRKDPNYVPALVDLAMVRYRTADYEAARSLARHALSVDAYDPSANYYFALASQRLGRTADALDGFEGAALSPEYRGAAWTGLSRLYLAGGDLPTAVEYSRRSVGFDPLNLEGYQVLAVAERTRGNAGDADSAIKAILAIDPLSHFARCERFLSSGSEQDRRFLLAGIRSEMPVQTLLELAIWYYGIGRIGEAARVLQLAPTDAEALYWLSFVQDRLGERASEATLARAASASPRLVFPFRPESADVLRWAAGKTEDWRPKYYLALLEASFGNEEAARALLVECGQSPDYAPFYVVRARLLRQTASNRAPADLLRAAEIEPREWRFGKLLIERYIQDRDYRQALAAASRYAAAVPDNYVIGMLHAKTLLLSGQPAATVERLGRLSVLPYEGSTEGRALYREAHLMLALEHWGSGRPDRAIEQVTAARAWPENLGAGKPYSEDVDERLEDWLEAQCLDRLGRVQEARARLERLAAAEIARAGVGRLMAAMALRKLGRQSDAARALSSWAAEQSDPRLADWGRRIFAGGSAALPDDVAVSEEHRVLARFVALTKGVRPRNPVPVLPGA